MNKIWSSLKIYINSNTSYNGNKDRLQYAYITEFIIDNV